LANPNASSTPRKASAGSGHLGQCQLVLAPRFLGVKESEFMNFARLVQECRSAQVNAFVIQLSTEQGSQARRQHTVESVNPNLLVGLMAEQPATQGMAVLHVAKGFLALSLVAKGFHDLLRGRAMLVGDDNGFAE